MEDYESSLMYYKMALKKDPQFRYALDGKRDIKRILKEIMKS